MSIGDVFTSGKYVDGRDKSIGSNSNTGKMAQPWPSKYTEFIIDTWVVFSFTDELE